METFYGLHVRSTRGEIYSSAPNTKAEVFIRYGHKHFAECLASLLPLIPVLMVTVSSMKLDISLSFVGLQMKARYPISWRKLSSAVLLKSKGLTKSHAQIVANLEMTDLQQPDDSRRLYHQFRCYNTSER